ncbi:MAG: hypothetical protein ABJA79_09285, partial [Parafilimonas sp.]
MKAFTLKIILLSQLIVFSFLLHSSSQPAINIDSLISAANNENNSIKKINLYFSIGHYLRNTNADSAVLFNKV